MNFAFPHAATTIVMPQYKVAHGTGTTGPHITVQDVQYTVESTRFSVKASSFSNLNAQYVYHVHLCTAHHVIKSVFEFSIVIFLKQVKTAKWEREFIYFHFK